MQILQCVIALGSNTDSQAAFATATSELGQLGDVQLSSLIVGRDFTGRTERIYHNAVAMLTLSESLDDDKLNHLLKNIEKKCGRNPCDRACVPMDLDILAVFDGKDWHTADRRLPFKAHEMVGLREVAGFLLD